MAKGAVSLNVGGTVHLVKWETIDKFPKSRLQKLRYATTQGNTDICGLQKSYQSQSFDISSGDSGSVRLFLPDHSGVLL